MDQEQVIRLTLRKSGFESLDELKGKSATAKAELNALSAAYREGLISEEKYGSETKQLTKTLDGYASALDRVEKQLARKGVATDKATKGMQNLGYAGMETGRIFQDVVQGGIGGGLNNIERMVQFLGGGPGLAGALTAVGVALFIFRDQIKEVFDTFMEESVDAGRSHVERLEERIKQLTDKKHRIPIETFELENAKTQIEQIKAALAAVERLSTRQTKVEQESGKQFVETFAEQAPGGAEEATRQMVGKMTRDLTAQSQPLIDLGNEAKGLKEVITKRRAALEKGVDIETGTEMTAEIAAAERRLGQIATETTNLQQTIEKNARLEIGKMIEAAEKGRGEAQKIGQAGVINYLRMAGVQGGFPEQLEQVAPAQVQAKQAQKKADKLDKEAQEISNWFDAQVAAVDKAIRDKETDALNKQGAEGERDALKQLREMRAEEKQTGERELGRSQKRLRADVEGISAATSLDEQAAALAAQMEAQGGMVGPTGRFQRMDQPAQFAALAGMIQKQIQGHPGARGMAPEEIESVAAKMALDAQSKVGAMTLEATRAGQGNTQAMLGVTMQLTQQAEMALANQRMMAAQINGLGRDVSNLNARTRTVLRRGQR